MALLKNSMSQNILILVFQGKIQQVFDRRADQVFRIKIIEAFKGQIHVNQLCRLHRR